MNWVVEKQKPGRRGSIEDGTSPVGEIWSHYPHHPSFLTRAEAVRWLACHLDPSLPTDASQLFYERHYQKMYRNQRYFRVRRTSMTD